MNAKLLETEIRAKLALRILPNYGPDDWYDGWVATLDEATAGVMEVLNKYNVEERDGTR